MEALRFVFPAQEFDFKDVMSTFSGLRPVVNTGKADPSKESREHAIWDENGLLTVTGGKLTTFRIMARDALKAARKYLGHVDFDVNTPVLNAFPPEAELHLADSTGDMNKLALSVCFVGNFDKAPPPPDQLIVFRDRIWLPICVGQFGLNPGSIVFHRDFAPWKSCPGTAFTKAYLSQFIPGMVV